MSQFRRRCEYCLRVDRGNAACPRCNYNGVRHNKPYMLREGTQLTPRYMLGHYVGQGGFSICYRAWDNQADEMVAIKELFLADQRSGRGEGGRVSVTHALEPQFTAAKQGLKREADVLKKLAGEIGIVRIHDYFEANDTAYLVTDYLPGLSYSEHLRQQFGRKGGQHIDVTTAVDVAIRLLDSLQSLHSRNLLHLDVKPTNIQVTHGDLIVLLDLGSARDAFRDPASGWTGAYTLGFSAPEQFFHEGEVTPKTDVYALAATLYYSLSLEVPSWANRRIEGEALIPLSHYNQAVPLELEQVIEAAMSLDADSRYPTAADFKRALRPFGSQVVVMAPPATQASRQQRLGGGLIDTLLGLCAALVLDHDGHSGDSPLIFIAGCLLLQIVAPPILGGTPGMRLQGFRLRRDDGEPPQLPQILTRAILTCAAFFLFLTWQPDGTMVHDRVTGTRIVRP